MLSQLPGEVPDLLLADLALPGENGCELMRRIRRLEGPAGRIAAMAVTAYTGPPTNAARSTLASTCSVRSRSVQKTWLPQCLRSSSSGVCRAVSFAERFPEASESLFGAAHEPQCP